ncbi:hypothetical protein SS50377_22834 [Spironucleus salmonicida]|uniref:Uncharacterized protein n=1 Tax=Spironucleus salmonicida TaxID=348837 RepID=V6LTC4_9EUKA|nr:hypothetical protein SS50377_22834 [Spironucleus salmonicida]|eukprot:EST47897.1 Hypothetical protein SS50377_11998 [Spironucleus salmonicida]
MPKPIELLYEQAMNQQKRMEIKTHDKITAQQSISTYPKLVMPGDEKDHLLQIQRKLKREVSFLGICKIQQAKQNNFKIDLKSLYTADANFKRLSPRISARIQNNNTNKYYKLIPSCTSSKPIVRNCSRIIPSNSNLTGVDLKVEGMVRLNSQIFRDLNVTSDDELII